METSLRDELAALAESGAATRTPRAGDAAYELWGRGKRLQRRRRLASVVAVVALVVGVGTAGLVLPSAGFTASPQPVATKGEPRLPDRLFTPSPWLPTTGEAGPIGPLALVIGGAQEKSLMSAHEALVGVSAVTGEYRFLSLPGYRPSPSGSNVEEVALSSDGRYLAYWYRDAPRTLDDYGASIPADGIAVYDTVTAEVTKRPLRSSHGLLAEPPRWAGSQLWINWYQAVRAGSGDGRLGRVAVWDVAGGALEVMPPRFDLGVQATAVGDYLVSLRVDPNEVLEVQALAADGGQHRYHLGAQVKGRIAVTGLRETSPSWEPPEFGYPSFTIAAPSDRDRRGVSTSNASPIVVARLAVPHETMTGPLDAGTHGAVSRHLSLRAPFKVPRVKVHSVTGWRDGRHVVAIPEQVSGEPFAYASVDVKDGATETLVRPARGVGAGNYLFAQDAWTWPTWHAPAPPIRGPYGVPVVPGWLLLVLGFASVPAILGLRHLRRRRAHA